MSICLWTGCMYSGKTSQLLKTARIHEVQLKKKVLYVQHHHDTRYKTNEIISHDSLWRVTAKSVENLSDLDVSSYDVIALDEGQFFDDLVENCEAWAQEGKVVLVSALVSDYRREGFQNVLSLIPLVEEVVSLTAICHTCKKEAHFTHKMKLGDDNERQIEIGGKELYIPLCRRCYTQQFFNLRHV